MEQPHWRQIFAPAGRTVIAAMDHTAHFGPASRLGHPALELCAAGIGIGRNVWQHADPGGMTRALAALVHGGATVDQALGDISA